MKKWVGSVSLRAASAFSVAVSWAALVVGDITLGSDPVVVSVVDVGVGVDVAVAGGVRVGPAFSDGTCNNANRFLSDSATALRISGSVTFNDLSFRQDSLTQTG